MHKSNSWTNLWEKVHELDLRVNLRILTLEHLEDQSNDRFFIIQTDPVKSEPWLIHNKFKVFTLSPRDHNHSNPRMGPRSPLRNPFAFKMHIKAISIQPTRDLTHVWTQNNPLNPLNTVNMDLGHRNSLNWLKIPWAFEVSSFLKEPDVGANHTWTLEIVPKMTNCAIMTLYSIYWTVTVKFLINKKLLIIIKWLYDC